MQLKPQRLVYILDSDTLGDGGLPAVIASAENTIRELDRAFFGVTSAPSRSDEVAEAPTADDTHPAQDPIPEIAHLVEAFEGLSVREMALLSLAAGLRMNELVTGHGFEAQEDRDVTGLCVNFISEFGYLERTPSAEEAQVRDTVKVYTVLREEFTHAETLSAEDPGVVEMPVIAVELTRNGGRQAITQSAGPSSLGASVRNASASGLRA